MSVCENEHCCNVGGKQVIELVVVGVVFFKWNTHHNNCFVHIIVALLCIQTTLRASTRRSRPASQRPTTSNHTSIIR